MAQNQIIKIQDGETVIELTADEKKAFLADMKTAADERALLSPEQAAKAAARESALAKLADLGLTAEEIAAL
jgi:hypothetical protein